MKRLFVSTPMAGKDRIEIEEEMAYCLADAEAIEGEELDLIESLLPEDTYKNYSPLMCLSVAIEMLSNADVVYFSDGWEEARGCKIEHACAKEYGLTIIKD